MAAHGTQVYHTQVVSQGDPSPTRRSMLTYAGHSTGAPKPAVAAGGWQAPTTHFAQPGGDHHVAAAQQPAVAGGGWLAPAPDHTQHAVVAGGGWHHPEAVAWTTDPGHPGVFTTGHTEAFRTQVQHLDMGVHAYQAAELHPIAAAQAAGLPAYATIQLHTEPHQTTFTTAAYSAPLEYTDPSSHGPQPQFVEVRGPDGPAFVPAHIGEFDPMFPPGMSGEVKLREAKKRSAWCC